MILGLVALAILGAFMAVRDADGDQPSVADRPSPVTSGALKLYPLPGWTKITSAPRLGGLDFRNPVVLREHFSGTRLVGGLLPATSWMLLPPEFVRRLLVRPTRPEIAKLGRGAEAYYFGGLILANGGQVEVYVLPTTAGVAAIACLGGRGLAPPHDDCWRNAATLQVRGGRPLRLGSEAAFRQRLPGAVTALEHARQQARAGLATHVPAQQAAAASRLSRSFQAQAASLAPLAPASRRWSRALVRELAGAGRAYGGVAAALRDSDGAAFQQGEDAVRAREHRIKQLLNSPTDG
jgi:hypothetical protein